MKRLIVFAMLACLAGCGKRGALEPPPSYKGPLGPQETPADQQTPTSKPN
jgi:predicted small lipoprotein YifL